jgi:dCTP deaminase
VSVLVDRDILAHIQSKTIVIEPFETGSLGTNSYDVHLAETLKIYKATFDQWNRPLPLDVLEPRETVEIDIPEEGYVLKPGELYLGATVEYTESHEHVPMLSGKSSLGRLGLSVHVTAGTGDVGFCNHWTLELTVVHPLRVYAGMPIGQLMWYRTVSDPLVRYKQKKSAKYTSRDAKPQASEAWRNVGPWESRARKGRRTP